MKVVGVIRKHREMEVGGGHKISPETGWQAEGEGGNAAADTIDSLENGELVYFI